MKRNLLRSIVAAVVLSLAANSHQGAVAQALREPTVDEQFRDKGAKAPEETLPQLRPAQSNAARAKPAPPAQAYLGVSFMTDRRDAYVRKVQPGSPAEQAGLQPNDVIETLQGRPVRSYQDVINIVAKMKPGDMLEVGYSRRMNVRTQAALAGMPTPTPHQVGYPQDAPKSTSGAPEDPDQELIPKPQSRNEVAPGQRRSGNQDSNPDDYRPFRGRFRRR